MSSGLAYAPFYYGQIEWRSDTMKNEARSFAKESELEIETITVETLYILEEVLSKLELSSTDNESLITSEFNSQIELLFRQNPDWQTFSFSVQLIDSNGDPISEFTSNLNAPGWTKAYDMFSLEVPYVQERIRRERLRPIIRRNPLEQPLQNTLHSDKAGFHFSNPQQAKKNWDGSYVQCIRNSHNTENPCVL